MELPLANPQQAESVWEILEQKASAKLKQLSLRYQNALRIVLGNSNFLARWCRRFPEKAVSIFQDDIEVPLSLSQYQLALQAASPQLEDILPETLLENLLHFKYQQLLRITIRDMGLKKDFSVIAAEISDLAQSITQIALRYHLIQMNQKFGTPLLKQNSQINEFCVLAMGKLGGQELNYSSDIDLIYFYESDDGFAQNSDLNPHQFFVKLSEQFTRFLNQKSGGGFLYRVDLELRPEGNSGSLANSLDAMESYYENFGAAWEKQAMIKARVIAGSRKLGAQFFKRIHPFIYPKTTDYSFLEHLRNMKGKITQSIEKSSAKGYHVKLGKGGIREIEFFVQSLQVLFGGKTPSLQTSNTLKAIKQLTQAELLKTEESQRLSDAYIFLRTLENRLQQIEEQQTHRLPENPKDLIGMAHRMGFFQNEDSLALEMFLKKLDDHRQFVQASFERLLNQPRL